MTDMPRPRPEPGRHDTQQQQLGWEVRQRREALGLSVEAVAAAVGRDRRVVRALEDGRELPSEAVIHRLDETLHAKGLIASRYDGVVGEKRLNRYYRSFPTLTAAPDADPLSDASTFIAETIHDGQLMAPGEPFTKTWTIRNSGTKPWRNRYLRRLGDSSGGGLITTPPMTRIDDTEPGDVVSIHMPCLAQYAEGDSVASFKMSDELGRLYFPDRYHIGVQVRITVVRGRAPRKP
ncbi:helix-turn-helix domain-containing protein [Curtobacterium sp. 22159]|uniref:helix-turn-helix domain-containing protein n=1 Tax=Curtobacterium sp. 22159 TaxID=3453882 RepID=UPI003F83CE5C